VVCVNNKQHLFNLNGNDGNNISIFNFQVIWTAYIRHGRGIVHVRCPVEAIALEHWFQWCYVTNGVWIFFGQCTNFCTYLQCGILSLRNSFTVFSYI
jgi:hypothetical protein